MTVAGRVARLLLPWAPQSMAPPHRGEDGRWCSSRMLLLFDESSCVFGMSRSGHVAMILGDVFSHLMLASCMGT